MSKKTLLLIEDEANLRNSLVFILAEQGYEVLAAATGEEGLELARRRCPQLALVDIGLPGMDGFEVAEKLSDLRRNQGLMIVFLTGSDAEDDMVRAFEDRADDYMVKPVRPRVLMARIRCLLERRSAQGDEELQPLKRGPLHVDPAAVEVLLEGAPLHLTPTEFKILLHLARHPGRAFSRSDLITAIHGEDCHLTEKAIDFQVHSLRRKLGDHADLIQTVRGVGFKLRAV